MNGKPHPRHEKNRHHLGTAVSVVLGAVILLGVNVVLPQSKWICMPMAIVYGLVLFGRTVVIELSIRRSPIGAEAAFEHTSRRWIARSFGIIAVEECCSDSDSEHPATGIPKNG